MFRILKRSNSYKRNNKYRTKSSKRHSKMSKRRSKMSKRRNKSYKNYYKRRSKSKSYKYRNKSSNKFSNKRYNNKHNFYNIIGGSIDNTRVFYPSYNSKNSNEMCDKIRETASIMKPKQIDKPAPPLNRPPVLPQNPPPAPAPLDPPPAPAPLDPLPAPAPLNPPPALPQQQQESTLIVGREPRIIKNREEADEQRIQLEAARKQVRERNELIKRENEIKRQQEKQEEQKNPQPQQQEGAKKEQEKGSHVPVAPSGIQQKAPNEDQPIKKQQIYGFTTDSKKLDRKQLSRYARIS